ncbi:hypothetical protein RchiOBHm_Chr3g0451411 [Rosa chinensis]|uniref:Uncharacterized protein n=1 Tax=Rosa chinensis TaxID=74649 RepID=A0A2P6R611_ROSCH|nr:hypothetical protein RchiOBHm_Chr3g0451411 [Rosa chinensis]
MLEANLVGLVYAFGSRWDLVLGLGNWVVGGDLAFWLGERSQVILSGEFSLC